MHRIILCLALMLAIGHPATAMHHGKAMHHSKAQDDAHISVHHARLMLGIGARPGVLHADISNRTDKDLRLIAADSPSFSRIEMHTHETMPDGMMRMTQVEHFTLDAKATLKLNPGGDHLMLFGFNGEIGDAVSIDLRFNDGSTHSVTVRATARKKHGGGGHHGH